MRKIVVCLTVWIIFIGCVKDVRFIPDETFVNKADSFYISIKFCKSVYNIKNGDEEFKIRLKTGSIAIKSTEILGVKKKNKQRNYVVNNSLHNIELKATLFFDLTFLKIDLLDKEDFESVLEIGIDESIEMVVKENGKNVGSIVRFKNPNGTRERFLCMFDEESVK